MTFEQFAQERQEKLSEERLRNFGGAVLDKILKRQSSSEAQAPQPTPSALREFAEHVDITDEGQLHEIDETAAIIAEKIDPDRLGLHHVIDTLEAWNVSRSEETEKLAMEVLDLFPGVAKENLTKAFIEARSTGVDFDEALDKINGERGRVVN